MPWGVYMGHKNSRQLAEIDTKKGNWRNWSRRSRTKRLPDTYFQRVLEVNKPKPPEKPKDNRTIALEESLKVCDLGKKVDLIELRNSYVNIRKRQNGHEKPKKEDPKEFCPPPFPQ